MHNQTSFKVTWTPHDHHVIMCLTSESLQTQAPVHLVTKPLARVIARPNGSSHDQYLHGPSHGQTGHCMTNHLSQTVRRTHVDLIVWPSTNCVQYRGLGYSYRFVWLCRVCALYPHYGVLPPSSTSELVPQEPRNSSYRSGLGLLQRDRSTECLPYRITRHASQVMPWVAQCPPDTPAIAWQLTIAWSNNFVPRRDGAPITNQLSRLSLRTRPG